MDTCAMPLNATGTAAHDARGERTSIARNLARYTPSVLFGEMVSILNAIIRPKLLSPDLFGLWSLLNVIPSYSSYLHLGSRDYLRYQIPRLEAKGDHDAVSRMEATALMGALAPNLAVALALALLALFSSFETLVRTGLATMSILVLLTCVFEYTVNAMKGHQRFRDLARANYLRATTQLALSTGLMLWLGLYGLYIAVPLAMLITLLYLRTSCTYHAPSAFQWSLYREMVREGYAITLFAFLMTLLVTAGRLVVAGYLTTEEVGYYALATLALRGMLNFPGAAREVVEPRIMEAADSLEEESVLDTFLYRPLVANAFYLPFIIIPGYYFIPPLLTWLLPKYTAGIVPLQLILFGFYFLATAYPLRGILIGLRLQRPAALLMALCVILTVGFSLLALHTGHGIVGVSVANSLSYALMLIFNAWLLKMLRRVRFPLRKVWPVWIVFPFMCSGIWASDRWLKPLLPEGFIAATVQTGLLCLLGVAVVLWAGHRMPLMAGVRPQDFFRKGKKRRDNN